ncbi:BadF/BadG/BcrA/BcrD ATPase family protein [Streptosporangium carneum]|uniref:ATPase n=1 Tax=Streptosporangium carneum TaxID=47481 RepID=A0A9W6I019_9ACTN|nr:BadF/BadG/BcrA/BcrD ATPase family protein [Streptosporangium carneum]GLK08495.1 ATPase [Streptosporangium carneum]
MSTLDQPRRGVAGLDIGGSYLRVRVEDAATGEPLAAETRPNAGWNDLSPTGRARLIRGVLRRVTPAGHVLAAVGVGARGCDSEALTRELEAAVSAELGPGVTVQVCNDALLVGLAGGREHALSVIAGTGAVVGGRTADGVMVLTDGWGWLLGDHGSAPRIVVDALRLYTACLDRGESDPVFGPFVAGAFAVTEDRRLPGALKRSRETLGDFAAGVFECAEAGSHCARQAIADNAWRLAGNVVTALRLGVRADSVVGAGAIMVKQPAFRSAFASGLVAQEVSLPLSVLDTEPVLGAVRLARLALRNDEEQLA